MSVNRRSYGTGTFYSRADALGREWWYGRWHNGASRPNRKIGPIRTRGGEEGLTRREAKQALRKLIDAKQPKYAGAEVTIAEAGDCLLRHHCYWFGPTSSSSLDRNSLRIGEVLDLL